MNKNNTMKSPIGSSKRVVNITALSLYGQLALLIVLLFLRQVIGNQWSIAISALLLLCVTLKVKNFIRGRQVLFKIFEKGGIPSVGNKNWITGNFCEVIGPPDVHVTIKRIHKRLGETFGHFYASTPVVETTDLDLLQKIFVTYGNKHIDKFEKRSPDTEEYSGAVSNAKGDEWRKTRRILNPCFSAKQMSTDNVHHDIDLSIEKLLSCIDGHPIESGSKTSRLVDVLYNFKKFSADVILRVSYGTEDGINMKPLARDSLIEAVDEYLAGALNPITIFCIMTNGFQKVAGYLVKFLPVAKSIKLIHSILDKRVEYRRHLVSGSKGADTTGSHRRAILDSLIESADKGSMSDVSLKANLYFLFLAGFDTTASSLTTLFWLLANHQDVQDKLRQSLTIEGSESQYLNWCIREALRLYPPVPGAIGRTLVEDVRHKDQTLFKGTVVVASIYSIGRSRDIWGSDVEEFRPERFAEDANFHPVQEFNFGHGPRMCLGKKLALSEMKTVVPRVLLRYKIERSASTPRVLNITSPNLIHVVIKGPVELKFNELSSL